MSDVIDLIAQKLRLLRHQKGWSLSACAAQTGVSKAMLGQIERAESSPTVAILWKIATGMDVSLSSLITDPTQQATAQPAVYELNQAGISVITMLPYDNASQQEVYRLEIQPGAESFSSAHRAGTLETIMVVTGTLDIWVNGQWSTVETGKAYLLHADQEHGYRNSSDELVVFHDVISYR